jgi:hypothetical protein
VASKPPPFIMADALQSVAAPPADEQAAVADALTAARRPVSGIDLMTVAEGSGGSRRSVHPSSGANGVTKSPRLVTSIAKFEEAQAALSAPLLEKKPAPLKSLASDDTDAPLRDNPFVRQDTMQRLVAARSAATVACNSADEAAAKPASSVSIEAPPVRNNPFVRQDTAHRLAAKREPLAAPAGGRGAAPAGAAGVKWTLVTSVVAIVLALAAVMASVGVGPLQLPTPFNLTHFGATASPPAAAPKGWAARRRRRKE